MSKPLVSFYFLTQPSMTQLVNNNRVSNIEYFTEILTQNTLIVYQGIQRRHNPLVLDNLATI